MTYEKRDNPGHQLRVIRDVSGKKLARWKNGLDNVHSL